MQVQKDIRQMNTADFVAQYTNDHVIGETNKIMSDDCSHYVLLKKIIQKNKKEPEKLSDRSEINSSMTETKNAFITNLENIDVDEVSIIEKDTFDDVEVKQEVESDDNAEDVDDPLLMNSDSLSETKSEEPKDGCKSSSANSDNLFSSKQAENDDGQICMEQVDSTKECKTLDPALNNEDVNLSSSEDELIPCEEIDPENIHLFGGNLESETSIKNPVSLASSDSVSSEKSRDVANSNLSMESGEVSTEMKVSSTGTTSSTTTEAESFSKEEKLKTPSHQIEAKVQNEDISHIIETEENLQLQRDLEMARQLQLEEDSKAAQLLQIPTEPKPTLESLPSTSTSNPIPKPLSEKEKAEMMAKNLQLQKDLEAASSLLEADRAKQDRQNTTVQDHMVEECKELLRLFGVPYVVGPAEAEAQCAFYDAENLTHGTITDDSDVWLFGGKRVYKNFFTQHKHVEFYKEAEIISHFGLSRKKLINFALLTGSDYTEGIEGVGRVTAMEILSEFPGDDMEALVKFKNWWEKFTRHAIPPENKVRAKLAKLVLAERFPDAKVVDAYLNPDVDHSTEKFSWGRPDLDALRDYARERFGWKQDKVDEVLLPVIKKLNERDAQTHIDNFFSVNLKKQKDLFPSKRIMSALKKIKSPKKGETSQEAQTSTSTNKRKGRQAGKKAVPPKKKGKKVEVPAKSTGRTKPKAPVLSEESSDED